MLRRINISNYILIESLDLQFPEGLIIVTGETGAGKSILLGSVNLALGQKMTRGMIREGADYALDPTAPSFYEQVSKLTEGRGFQSIIEASGSTSGAESAMKTIGRGGRVVFFSMYPDGYHLPLDMWKMFKDEVTVCGVYQSPYVFPRVMNMIAKLDVSPLTATIFPLKDFDKAWEAQLSKNYPKIVLKVAD